MSGMKATSPAAATNRVPPIPKGYHTASPYLVVNNATAALDFYVTAFGAAEVRRLPTPDGKIMHAEIKIGDSIIMLSDEFPDHDSHSPEHFGGSPMFVVLYVEDVDARFAPALAAGATSLRPVSDQFFGDRSGTLLDPFGHRWNLTTHIADVSAEEIQRLFTEMMNAASATASPK
jgi:PhnB protein